METSEEKNTSVIFLRPFFLCIKKKPTQCSFSLRFILILYFSTLVCK